MGNSNQETTEKVVRKAVPERNNQEAEVKTLEKYDAEHLKAFLEEEQV